MFKYLGMQIQFDLNDNLIRAAILSKLRTWLEKVNSTLLTGPMKAWIVNHHVCLKLSWSLIVYDFPKSQANDWQDVVHKYYRRWMGLAKSAEPSILYRSRHHFGLGFKHLGDMREQLQVVRWHIMKTSTDPNARALYKHLLQRDGQGHVGTGRRTTPRLKLEELERTVALDQMAPANTGRGGLGLRPKPTPNRKTKRLELIAALKRETEQKRLVIVHGYEMQNGWMQWGLDRMMDQDLTWNELIYRYSEQLAKFVLNAQLQTLPTPDNLRRWHRAQGVLCGLCGRREVTLKHILAGCSWVFSTENALPREDRYTWRHNCCLRRVAEAILAKLQSINSKPPPPSSEVAMKKCNFIKHGQRGRRSRQAPSGVLEAARDWKCNFDLPELRRRGGQMVFPADICPTAKRIDGYIVSRSQKICVLGPEMTSPMDDNVEKWHQIKKDKYRQQVESVTDWTFFDLDVEVGALGWIPPSTHSQLRQLGFSTKELTTLKRDLRYLARKCSYVIFVNRFNRDFHPWRLTVSSGECGSKRTMPSAYEPLLDTGPPLRVPAKDGNGGDGSGDDGDDVGESKGEGSGADGGNEGDGRDGSDGLLSLLSSSSSSSSPSSSPSSSSSSPPSPSFLSPSSSSSSSLDAVPSKLVLSGRLERLRTKRRNHRWSPSLHSIPERCSPSTLAFLSSITSHTQAEHS